MARTVDALQIVANKGFSSNTYLLATGADEKCVVIDPGLDSASLDKALHDVGWTPEAVICTHGHFDHVGGAAQLQEKYQTPVYLSVADQKVAKMSNFLMSVFKIESRISLPEFEYVEEQDSLLHCGGRSFLLHSVPGHTPGSVAVEVDGLLFSGDSLYAKKVALSQLPGEDPTRLRQSLRRLLTRVGRESRVLPGHGSSAPLATILRDNHELLEFMAQPE